MKERVRKGRAAKARLIEARLANGLRVRLLPKATVPTAAVYLFFPVGSRNERPGITGISHLLEHMYFNGAARYGPKEFDRTLEACGGHSNAYTTQDLTVYHEEFPAEALETVLDLESDRMRSLCLDPDLLAGEREVVREERRMRVENDIQGAMEEELEALAYHVHPYRWPVIGWMQDIERITRDDCVRHYRAHYAPNRATLYLAGDLEPAKALRLVRRYFEQIPPGPPVEPPSVREPEPRGERRSEVGLAAQSPAVMVGFRGPAAGSAEVLALDVAQCVLAVGDSSWLMKELVFEDELAVSVSMDWTWRIDPGLVTFFLELPPGADPKEAEEGLYRRLGRLARGGPSERELERARNILRVHALSELETNSRRANALGTYEAMLGSWREGLALPDRYARISREEVRSAAACVFERGRRSVVTLVPREEVRA